MVKRLADWLEKISVALVVISLFDHFWKMSFIQGFTGLVVGGSAFLLSMYLTALEE